ncbi:outer membrane lipoprotein-sorting protein [Roseimicrobium gellanilyticum]|uniref:outer membrane lipoprotein-sorting protein n=1 Tax=Roseimicrobium gellanilyticum TaxID=748857 RepID=UPI001472A3AB|nr:outer membrane lipoprotein-sorting protein [Roseimicrobium gellanilyticum]
MPFASASAQGSTPKPTGDGILEMVRMSQATQDLDQLKGQLRTKGGLTHPFTLTMADKVIRFVFPSPPKETISLDLKETSSTLTRVNASGKVEMPAALYAQPVLGTAINYEDLAMRFLYWPNAKVMDENALLAGFKCWVVRVQNPDGRGPYQWVDLWVSKSNGAMLKMEAWDKSPRKVKQFLVRSGQRYQGAFILKQMRVYAYDPATGKAGDPTYLEIDDPD